MAVSILNSSMDGGLFVENTRGSIEGVVVWPSIAMLGTDVSFVDISMILLEIEVCCNDFVVSWVRMHLLNVRRFPEGNSVRMNSRKSLPD